MPAVQAPVRYATFTRVGVAGADQRLQATISNRTLKRSREGAGVQTDAPVAPSQPGVSTNAPSMSRLRQSLNRQIDHTDQGPAPATPRIPCLKQKTPASSKEDAGVENWCGSQSALGVT